MTDTAKHARDMTPAEYKAARAAAAAFRNPPVRVIADGKHASKLSDDECKAALAAIGVHRASLMR